MKVLVVTDSLGLPRPVPEKVMPHETWVSLLAAQYDLVQFSSGGATIGDLYAQSEYMKMHEPDAVVIQSGIVDCAPRAFSRFENEFINKFRLTRSLSKRFLNKNRIVKLRAKRNVTYTPILQFEAYMRKFESVFPNIVWVEIAPSNEVYEKKVPGITENISKYNAIIKKVAGNRVIQLSDLNADDIMSDHIHLNVSGNRKLSEKVKAALQQNNQ